MISVSDGQARILAQITTVAPPELIPVGRALGRVTALDIRSSMDIPPTDNSAVDGYAVASCDIPASGERELDIVGELAAGAVFSDTLRPGQALRGAAARSQLGLPACTVGPFRDTRPR